MIRFADGAESGRATNKMCMSKTNVSLSSGLAQSEHRSLWVAQSGEAVSHASQTDPLPAGGGALEADVCIIGAGIAGLTTAYLLAKAGRKVIMLDAGPTVAQGESSRTTAQLASEIDDRYFEIERLHGQHGARLAAESQQAAIDFIERTAAEEALDCGFVRLPAYLFLGPEDSPDLLDRELAAAARAGVPVERLDQTPLPDGGVKVGPCLRFPRQGQFDPLRYLGGLARAVRRMGGRIHANVRAGAVSGDKSGGRVEFADTFEGGQHRGEVRAAAVVLATNTPYNDRVVIHTKQAAYRTYVIAARVRKGSVEPAIFWDTLDPYHYVRLQADDPGHAETELLVVGGEDHKTGQDDLPAEERYLLLEAWTRRHFPVAGEVVYRWSGQVMEPEDGLPFIGRNPLDSAHVFIATGDSGMGMTNGTAAGILLSDLILGRSNPWETLYDPARKTLGSLGEFLSENLNTAKQYLDLVKPGDVSGAGDIAPGEGAIIRQGASKLAVYKEESGELRCLSAICPHLGGVVRWNAEAKSWDCPCHGSRFDIGGAVLNGPSSSGLAPKTLDPASS
jgi:glycine/D-amino acid oxidase-like deaminating enzyme/nitrite reductase/ring-hydroxylating ferredoxin subunit